MAEGVPSGIVGMVFDKLGSMVLNELRPFKDVGEELEKLKSTLSTIRNVLEDAEARRVKDEPLVDWLIKKLEDVAHDIDDVLDEAAVEADLKHTPDQSKSKDMCERPIGKQSESKMMAEAFVSGIVGVVCDKLGSTVLDELRSLKDVGQELRKLASTLSTTRNVLKDAEARQAREKAIADWLKKLKDVAYDIDDVLDEAAVAGLKHRPDQFKCKEMVRKCLSLPETLQLRHEIARKIKEISKRLDMISEEKSIFHLTEGAAEHSHEVNFVPRETGSHVKCQVYGRNEDKKRIIDFLLNKCNEKNLGVMSIVGLGGLGKTTLAQSVYNDGQVSQHFGTKIWVYVSQKFDIKNVIRSVIESLESPTTAEFKHSSMDLMEQELLRRIRFRRFLLVLDDVWNEDYRQWETLESLLENRAKGSKVIVTTRSTRVASVMKSDELHSLGGLPDDDCWRLFEKHAFESDDGSANNRNLVAIGKEILKKCGGLPLAAKALGSFLRFKQQERQWQEVRDNKIWTQFKDIEEILPVLMLS